MAGFTTTNDDDWVFSFDDPVSKPSLPDGPNMSTNYLAGPGKWDNYSDNVLYECDSLIRQFFETKIGDPQWTQQQPKWRRYTPGMMFEILFGRKYDSVKDHRYGLRLAKVMGYYSTRIQKGGSVRGKKTTKKIYTLSLKRYKKLAPYSLKLRVEWLDEQGRLPTFRNMKLPNDNLKAGHARNPKTDENMERRREQGRKLYNERYGNRANQEGV